MYPNDPKYIKVIFELSSVRQQNAVWKQVVLLLCSTARLAMLSSLAEPNSATPRLIDSNGVLLLCLNRNDNLIWVWNSSSTTFGTGLINGTVCHKNFPDVSKSISHISSCWFTCLYYINRGEIGIWKCWFFTRENTVHLHRQLDFKEQKDQKKICQNWWRRSEIMWLFSTKTSCSVQQANHW